MNTALNGSRGALCAGLAAALIAGGFANVATAAPFVIDDDEFLFDADIGLVNGGVIPAFSAQIFRIYAGALGRRPDDGGFTWWATEIEEGRQDLRSMAAGFLFSAEFQSIADKDGSGDVSNNELIDHIYRNAFGREPDAEGFAWWTAELDSGRRSRTDVLVEMTQSNEYVTLTLDALGGFLPNGGTAPGAAANCPLWASATTTTAGAAACALPAEILVDRTLTSDIPWVLEGPTTVGNGNREMAVAEGVLADGTPVLSATLTIEPGTQVLGRTGVFSHLTITRGSQILAEGTEQLPIRFSADGADFEQVGAWGGLIIQGYAPNNECLAADRGAVPCNIATEGESGFSGGYAPEDSSGRLRYVSVAESGFEFSVGQVSSGITLASVGAGTQLNYVEVFSSIDDGIALAGGTASFKYLLLSRVQDDGLDWDEGWSGNAQYVLAVQSPLASGNAIEGDTEGTLDFLSRPTLANSTLIQDGRNSTVARFKATSGGFLHHSVLTTATGFPDGSTCVDASRAAAVGAELVFTNVVADCDAAGDMTLLPALIDDVALDGNLAAGAPEAVAVGVLDIEAINAAFPASLADPAFFDATDYAGAIDPSAARPCYEGWSIFAQSR